MCSKDSQDPFFFESLTPPTYAPGPPQYLFTSLCHRRRDPLRSRSHYECPCSFLCRLVPALCRKCQRVLTQSACLAALFYLLIFFSLSQKRNGWWQGWEQGSKCKAELQEGIRTHIKISVSHHSDLCACRRVQSLIAPTKTQTHCSRRLYTRPLTYYAVHIMYSLTKVLRLQESYRNLTLTQHHTILTGSAKLGKFQPELVFDLKQVL